MGLCGWKGGGMLGLGGLKAMGIRASWLSGYIGEQCATAYGTSHKKGNMLACKLIASRRFRVGNLGVEACRALGLTGLGLIVCLRDSRPLIEKLCFFLLTSGLSTEGLQATGYPYEPYNPKFKI